jgi:putative ubiquitin-RnfH superfamily antitoxin RatB of RatAB toxin-antitoxin module
VSEISVTVVFARPGDATEITVVAPVGATVADVIRSSNIAALHRDVDFTRVRVGIWGKLTDDTAPIADGDRVEIYRTLIADPKQQRRRRADKSAKS